MSRLFDKKAIPSYIIIVLCIVLYPLHISTASSVLHTYFLYSFCHVNIFHFLLNIIVLYRFKPRVLTVATSFIIALFVPMALDDLSFCLPTSGLSVLLYAAIARRYASWKLPIYVPIASNIPFILVNYFSGVAYYNYGAHLLAFLASYAFYRFIYYPYKKGAILSNNTPPK